MPTGAQLSDLSDAALVVRFRGGDEAGFRELYRRHAPTLFMLLQRILGGQRADAEDAMQETWLACCRGIHGSGGFTAIEAMPPSRPG